jgi:hypothetical protein
MKLDIWRIFAWCVIGFGAVVGVLEIPAWVKSKCPISFWAWEDLGLQAREATRALGCSHYGALSAAIGCGCFGFILLTIRHLQRLRREGKNLDLTIRDLLPWRREDKDDTLENVSILELLPSAREWMALAAIGVFAGCVVVLLRFAR